MAGMKEMNLVEMMDESLAADLAIDMVVKKVNVKAAWKVGYSVAMLAV